MQLDKTVKKVVKKSMHTHQLTHAPTARDRDRGKNVVETSKVKASVGTA